MIGHFQELRIEYVSWFDPVDIMPISKLPLLRKLSLRGCNNFFDIVVYASIAAVHGFPGLEVKPTILQTIFSFNYYCDYYYSYLIIVGI